MLLQVVGGPLVRLCLRANVTIPDMQISTDVVDFGEVKCGECRIVNVQLHNHQAVQCEWTAIPMEESKKQVKHLKSFN
jgi:hydrocephalus-inducing protein